MSPGCGTGVWEIDWARLGVFENITGIDISPEQIDRASQLTKDTGLDDVLSYRVGDARQVLREEGQVGVVLMLQALHHFRHVEQTMGLIARALRPGGLLIFDDYVGPSKYQWTKAQMQAANALLAELPAERRVQNDGRIKQRVLRPSLLSMRLDDPAEAAESAALMPALRRHFTIEEEHSYGSVLHLALQDVAHNFLGDGPATAEVVEQCIAAEEQALARLGPNFVLAVCRPTTSQAQDLRPNASPPEKSAPDLAADYERADHPLLPVTWDGAKVVVASGAGCGEADGPCVHPG